MKEMEREEKERIDRVLKEREMSDELYRRSVDRLYWVVVQREGKEIFKEKMKRQRLKGQSGIGDHFRTWRSEAEMKMRQEYM